MTEIMEGMNIDDGGQITKAVGEKRTDMLVGRRRIQVQSMRLQQGKSGGGMCKMR